MTTSDINEQQLSAYLDGELSVSERTNLAAIIERDEQLAARVSRMRQDMDLFKLAYEEPPLPEQALEASQPTYQNTRWMLAASVCLLLVGGLVGWQLHAPSPGSPIADHFLETASLDVNHLPDIPILLHISDMDDENIDVALSKAEAILSQNQQLGKPLQLEIVANANGLGLLREGSPYANRIQGLSDQYDNVSFKACGIAMENAHLKEGVEIILLPEAEKIPAALPRILKRVKQGWVYLKG